MQKIFQACYPQYQTYCNPGPPKELGGSWANTKSGRHCCNLQFAYHYQCAVVYDNDATLATWERGYANRNSTYLVERPLLSQACVWQLQKRAVQSWTSNQSHLLVRFKVQGGLNSTPTRASAVCQFELRAGVQATLDPPLQFYRQQPFCSFVNKFEF